MPGTKLGALALAVNNSKTPLSRSLCAVGRGRKQMKTEYGQWWYKDNTRWGDREWWGQGYIRWGVQTHRIWGSDTCSGIWKGGGHQLPECQFTARAPVRGVERACVEQSVTCGGWEVVSDGLVSLEPPAQGEALAGLDWGGGAYVEPDGGFMFKYRVVYPLFLSHPYSKLVLNIRPPELCTDFLKIRFNIYYLCMIQVIKGRSSLLL